jgi:hypothetical protein
MMTTRAVTATKADSHIKELFVTKDYSIFKTLKGNRVLDKHHIYRLKNKIEAEGNLTSEFPVNLNDNYEIIDGQHRIEALKELNFPVYYTISEGASLATVRQVNIARKNWNWYDYAQSFAAEGNRHYQDLLHFYDAFKFNYRILLGYSSGGKRIHNVVYQEGEFKILDRGMTFGLLNRLSEIRETLPFPTITNQLGSAFYDILNHPDYDHDRMVKKLTANGSQLHEWRKKADWLRNLEDIYNYGYSDENKTRFF